MIKPVNQTSNILIYLKEKSIKVSVLIIAILPNNLYRFMINLRILRFINGVHSNKRQSISLLSTIICSVKLLNFLKWIPNVQPHYNHLNSVTWPESQMNRDVKTNEFEKKLLDQVIPPKDIWDAFEDVGGLKNIKETLKELVMFLV